MAERHQGPRGSHPCSGPSRALLLGPQGTFIIFSGLIARPQKDMTSPASLS
jgi:hypothetical protein